MKRINIHEAKTHLSRHLAALKPGEVVICKNNEPIAELRDLHTRRRRARRMGAVVLLLDTCTFPWAATDDPCVPHDVKTRLQDPLEQVALSPDWRSAR